MTGDAHAQECLKNISRNCASSFPVGIFHTKHQLARGLFLIVSRTCGVLEIELNLTFGKKKHWHETRALKKASHDIHVVTSTRSMYIVRPKIPYFFPESPNFSFAFHSVCNAASDSDKTVARREQGMGETSTAHLTHEI